MYVVHIACAAGPVYQFIVLTLKSWLADAVEERVGTAGCYAE
jgi:hypothetical protein